MERDSRYDKRRKKKSRRRNTTEQKDPWRDSRWTIIGLWKENEGKTRENNKEYETQTIEWNRVRKEKEGRRGGDERERERERETIGEDQKEEGGTKVVEDRRKGRPSREEEEEVDGIWLGNEEDSGRHSEEV